MALDVTMPDGTIVRNVPEGTTKSQLLEKYQGHAVKSAMPLGGPTVPEDLAMTAGTGAIAGMAGSAAATGARLFNKDPEAARKWVSDHIQWNPRTPEVQQFFQKAGAAYKSADEAVTGGMNAVNEKGNELAGQVGGEPAQKALSATGDWLGGAFETTSDVLGATPLLGAASDVATGVKGIRAVGRATRAADVNRPMSPVEEARAGGLKLRPSDVARSTPGASVGKRAGALEASVGTEEGGNALNIENTKLLQDKAAESVGIDTSKTNGLLTEEAYAEKAAPHLAVYDELAKLREPQTSPFLTDVTRTIGRINTDEASAAAAPEIERLKARYASSTVGGASSQKLVDDVLSLRAQSKKMIQSGNVDMEERGWAAKKIADALDEELQARAKVFGSEGLASRFLTSRQALAKIHTFEDATRAGIIDPKLMLRAKQKGVPVHLDKNADFIARMQDHFPHVVKHPQSMSAGGKTDLGAGRLLVRAAQAVSRPIGKRILSGPYQRSLDRKTPVASRSKGVATVPGREYGQRTLIPRRPIHTDDESMVPGAVAHPGRARAAPLALPAPGNLALRTENISQDAPRGASRHPSYPALVDSEPMGLADSPLPGRPAGTGIPAHRVMVQPVETMNTNRGGQRPGPVRKHRNIPPENITLEPGERHRKPTLAQKRGRKLEDKLR